MKAKTAFVLSLLLLISFIFTPGASTVSSVLKLFTEGNSLAKHVVFLVLLPLFLLANIAFGKNTAFGKKYRLPKALLQELLVLLVVLGLVSSLFSQFYLNASFPSGKGQWNSFVTVMAPCADSYCWEGSYLQHIHVPKTAVYFAEKTFGLETSAKFDDGYPLYSILPNAEPIAAFFFVLEAIVLLVALLLATQEDSVKSLLLLFLAASFSLFAIIDGGPLSIVGVNAFIALSFYYFQPRAVKFSLPAFSAIIFAASLALLFLPQALFGSNIVFKNAFLAPLFLVSGISLSKSVDRRHFAFFLLLFLFSAGAVAEAAKENKNGVLLKERDLLVVYGLPPDATASGVVKGFADSGLVVSVLEKKGWFALARVENGAAGSKEAEEALKKNLNAAGYLFVERSEEVKRERDAEVIFTQPRMRKGFELALAEKIEVMQEGKKSVVRVLTPLSGSHLALQLLSDSFFEMASSAVVVSDTV